MNIVFELRAARYFVAVAEELHFGRAAARLRMSQPPLSQAIRRLEREVGAQLLERTNRSVTLTAAGRAFLTECRNLLVHAEAVAETPRLTAAGARGHLTLGTVASALHWPLPDALTLLRERAPHLAVSVHELDTHQVVPQLRQGTIDIALARLATSPTGIRTRVLLEDDFVALLPAGHRLAAGHGPLDLAGLADDPWVWLPREISPDYHDDMAATCRAAGFSPQTRHLAHSISSQIALVGCGLGVTIVPETAARTAGADIIRRPIQGAAATVTYSIATRQGPGNNQTLLAACLEDAIRAVQ